MNIGRLIRTLRHLKPSQLWFQVWRRVQRVLEQHPKCGSKPLGDFTFLNLTANPKGWNDTSLDMLWRYNLHYFDCLCTRNADDGEVFILKWIQENRKGSIPGWDSYPTSLRIVNWVKFLGRIDRNDRIGEIRESLKSQLDYLADHLEWHILANHLLANLKALVIGNRYLGRDNSKWRRLYRGQIDEQILPDGGHFERSVMYHAIILEDVLDVIRFCKDEAESLCPVAARMLRYLVNMTGPDGKIAMFNDAAEGIAKTTAEVCAYAKRLGFEIPQVEDFIDFPETGYSRLTAGDFVLFVDAGLIGPDYQPGHAHADTLTYELYYRGRKVVTDVGTSEYRGERRAYERSSAAHNVVEINGRDSSEVWSSHRVGARARIVVREVSSHRVYAAHNGYGFKVAREFVLGNEGLVITEHVAGLGNCITRIHLAKDAESLVSIDIPDERRENYQYALEFGKLEDGICLAAPFEPSKPFSYTIKHKGISSSE